MLLTKRRGATAGWSPCGCGATTADAAACGAAGGEGGDDGGGGGGRVGGQSAIRRTRTDRIAQSVGLTSLSYS